VDVDLFPGGPELADGRTKLLQLPQPQGHVAEGQHDCLDLIVGRGLVHHIDQVVQRGDLPCHEAEGIDHGRLGEHSGQVEMGHHRQLCLRRARRLRRRTEADRNEKQQSKNT